MNRADLEFRIYFEPISQRWVCEVIGTKISRTGETPTSAVIAAEISLRGSAL